MPKRLHELLLCCPCACNLCSDRAESRIWRRPGAGTNEPPAPTVGLSDERPGSSGRERVVVEQALERQVALLVGDRVRLFKEGHELDHDRLGH